MDNLKKLKGAFSKVLEISEENVIDELTYNSIQEWDLIGHMGLVTEIETILEIMLDTDDIKDMNSFATAKKILVKYDVTFITWKKIAFITGSTRGIGWSIARLFAQQWASILLNGVSDEELLHERVEKLKREYGVDAKGFFFDERAPDQIKNCWPMSPSIF